MGTAKNDTARAARAVAHGSLTALRRRALSRRFRQAVAASAGPVRVCAGAGTVSLPGWINTDVGWRPEYYLDLSRPWPVPAGSVSRIYADNVIEHFTLDVGRSVLLHMFEALESGGKVRLATPDVERTAQAYLERGDLAKRHLARHRSKGYVAEHDVDLLNLTWTVAEHYLGYCYDLTALSAELEDVGFVDIRREEVGTSQDTEFALLETRASETERATELVVEATKPEPRAKERTVASERTLG